MFILNRLLHGVLMRGTQSTTQLVRESLVTLFADWLLVVFVELGFLRHLVVAHGTRKMVNAPRLVECSENFIKRKLYTIKYLRAVFSCSKGVLPSPPIT